MFLFFPYIFVAFRTNGCGLFTMGVASCISQIEASYTYMNRMLRRYATELFAEGFKVFPSVI